MTSIILFILCYLTVGLFIGFIGGLWLILSNCEMDDACNFLLATSVLWPILILIVIIKFIISIPKAVKEYVIFLKQFLIR